MKAIDLGLPSGTLWADCNLGAYSPEENGNFYSWGEIEPKDDYSLENYKFYSKNNTQPNIGIDISGTEYDAASVALGNGWHVPTIKQCQELVKLCHWRQVNRKGYIGNEITGPNGMSIFIPSSGYIDGTRLLYQNRYGMYRSSTLDPSDKWGAWGMSCYANCGRADLNWGVFHGHCIRPVKN